MTWVAWNVGKHILDRDEYQPNRNNERHENLLAYFLQVLLTIWNHAPSIHASLSPECVSFLCRYPNQCHWNWSQILVFLRLIDPHEVVAHLNCQIYKIRNMLVDMEVLGWSTSLFSYIFCCMNFYWYLPLRKCIQDLVLIDKLMIKSSIVHTWENVKHKIQTHMHSGDNKIY